MDNVFLSASVPVRGRGDYFKTSEPFLIQAAVRSLVIHVLTTNRRIIWGGHPAITPMIWAVCQSLKKDYAKHFQLYQSRAFSDVYPEVNERFKNVQYAEKKEGLEQSLAHMRQQMLGGNQFEAGVFIGGMEGLEKEFTLFREMHESTQFVMVASTGGAALKIAEAIGTEATNTEDIDYARIFRTALPLKEDEPAPRPRPFNRKPKP